MFVCTGNICRSPLAEALFRDLLVQEGLADSFEVASSGTTAYHEGQSPDRRMRAVASRHGVEMTHRSRQLRTKDLEDYDLILAMDQSNESEIRYMTDRPELLSKVRMFRFFDTKGGKHAEVPDPYYGGDEGFEKVYTIVERTARSLLSRLRDEVASSSG